MNSPEEPSREPPVSATELFLSQPAFRAEEDADEIAAGLGRVHHDEPNDGGRLRRWFTHFMFEKDASQYSSVAPRSPDGKRSRIFFFNGNGRGR